MDKSSEILVRGTIIIVCVALTSLPFIYKTRQIRRLVRNGKRTKAHITRIDNPTKFWSLEYKRGIEYEFTDETGNTIRSYAFLSMGRNGALSYAAISAPLNTFHVGDTLTVFYDVNNPKFNTLAISNAIKSFMTRGLQLNNY